MQAAETRKDGVFGSGAAIYSRSALTTLLRLVALGLIDAFAIWFVSRLLGDGEWILAGFVTVATLGINAAFLIDGLYPYRWFAPGLVLLIIMIIFPTVFTVYVAFTNYRTGNLLTREQARDVLSDRLYLAEDLPTFSWTLFESKDEPGTYGLWIVPDSDRGGEAQFVTPGEATLASEFDLTGIEVSDSGVPAELPDWQQVPRGDAFRIVNTLINDPTVEFGEEDAIIKFNPARPQQVGVFRQRYDFDGDMMFDNETGVTYEAIDGTYTPVDGPYINAEGQVTNEDGEVLDVVRPGYYVPVGLENFERLINNDRIRGPFIRVFLWTFAHAFFSVFLTFWFGLLLALMLNAEFMPGRAILRTALLVPYAIPAFISVLVWRGLLNEALGVVNEMIESTLGVDGPRWRSDPNWVKVAILMIQLWLGFPYMMLITTGALQSIPGDIYEAARVDGANALQQFRFLTLPLLLVAVGPLLIASFAYNFNNFTIVELFAEGGPPIAPDSPAGHSDILITYTYELAFGSGRGADYGFASTISIVIFILVAVITFFNFRLTQRWEETSENV